MDAILGLLGGATFRAVLGQVTAWLTARQEHKHELARMKLQADLDDKSHARNLEAYRQQHELGYKTIQLQSQVDLDKLDAETFLAAQREAYKPTGVWLIDAWNGAVRPAFATVVLFMWVKALAEQDWKRTPWDDAVMASIIGFYFADRMLRKVGR